MKIERISEDQVRCTLTNEDLELRNVQISDLAYGTDDTRALFRDMMEEAEREFGFNRAGVPLFVEAVPGADGLVLTITKVENPEELDARFSKFTPRANTAGVLAGLLNRTPTLTQVRDVTDENRSSRFFLFESLEDVSEAARALDGTYYGKNTLYKLPDRQGFCLHIEPSWHDLDAYNRICNILSEYGTSETSTYATGDLIREHYEVLVPDHALEVMAKF